MAPPDRAPAQLVHRSFDVDPDDWDELRRLCISDHIAATKVVAALVHTYVRWPPALRAALLREIRDGEEGDT